MNLSMTNEQSLYVVQEVKLLDLTTKVRIMYIMLNEVYDQQLDNTEPFPSM